MNTIYIIVGLFLYVAWALPIYLWMRSNHRWVNMHWITKCVYAVWWLAYPADILLGALILAPYFFIQHRTIPKWYALTVSLQVRDHSGIDSFAKFMCVEILNIDPNHF